MNNPILNNIKKIPEGYSDGIYMDRKYGISKTIYNSGNSIKIYGEELGGKNFISLNYYITKEKELLKPCEMPKEKVIHFLENVFIKNEVKQ